MCRGADIFGHGWRDCGHPGNGSGELSEICISDTPLSAPVSPELFCLTIVILKLQKHNI
jgi:hypothetical protein